MDIETERVPRPKEDGYSLHVRTYLSIQHLQSARFFSQECKRLESEHEPNQWLQVIDRHQAFAIGTVLSTIAFLEATVNEMFTDASERFSSEHLEGLDSKHLEGLDDPVINRLGELWKLEVPKTTMQKYNIALTAADHLPMDLGKNPAQDVNLLIKLRNTGQSHYNCP